MRNLSFLLLLCLAFPAWGGVAERDDAGKTLFLDKPARRIISLAPSITELLFAAGAGKFLVGAVEYSDYPAGAVTLERVGNAGAIDIERIAALHPDLVVAWKSGNPLLQLRKLESLGIPVFRVDPEHLSDIPDEIEKLGFLSGTEETARQAAHAFRLQLERLKKRYSGKSKVKVFYEIWNDPLMTVNKHHFISDVMTLCGAVNVFGNLPSLVPTVSVEAVIKADPQIVIASGQGYRRPVWLDEWKKWKISTGFIPADLISRQSPRILIGAEQLCRQIDAIRDR